MEEFHRIALGRANVELQGSMCFPPDMSLTL